MTLTAVLTVLVATTPLHMCAELDTACTSAVPPLRTHDEDTHEAECPRAR
jgi:hypothetical protein